jgi:hypothetical protein
LRGEGGYSDGSPACGGEDERPKEGRTAIESGETSRKWEQKRCRWKVILRWGQKIGHLYL